MGRIDNLVVSACVQTAVYWGNPVKDGTGGFTYDEPVEIKCRWEDKWQLVKNETMNTELLSRAAMFVLQDVEEDAVVFLGTLNDLSSEAVEDPLSQDHVWIIKQFEKYPALHSTTEFVRKVYLSEYLF